MTEQDIKNFELINDIVRDYFSIRGSSYEKFKNIILNPEVRKEYIAPEFRGIIGEDHRAHYTLPNEKKIEFDDGWRMFQNIFYEFFHEFNMGYQNYLSNKIKINGQEVKLFKFLRKWYDEKDEYHRNTILQKARENSITSWGSSYEEAFKRATEKIGASKLPDKDLQITLSFNYADWFMCSTAENWSSCLNLQSDYEACFWSGLPGLIVDPNRVLLYITDGKTKSYRGITTKRFINRTWGMISENDEIVPIRHYPQEFLSDEDFANLFPFNVSKENMENYSFVSKYPLKGILYNKFDESIYIYQDFTAFSKNPNGDIYIESGPSGFHKVNDIGLFDEDTRYDYTEGLDGLIDSNSELIDHEDNGIMCSSCGDRCHEDDMLFGADEQMYCENCYSDTFCNCDVCGDSIFLDDAHFTNDGCYCEEHFSDRYSYCEDCGEVINNDEVIEHNNKLYCFDCFNEQFAECESCNTIVDNDEIQEYDGDFVCNECYKEKKASEKEEVA